MCFLSIISLSACCMVALPITASLFMKMVSVLFSCVAAVGSRELTVKAPVLGKHKIAFHSFNISCIVNLDFSSLSCFSRNLWLYPLMKLQRVCSR